MAYNARIVMKVILSRYQVFHSLNSLLEVGVGLEPLWQRLLELTLSSQASTTTSLMSWPLLRLFQNDKDCIKILKNCRKAIPDTGKVIIVDVVLDTDQGDNTDQKRKKVVDPIVGTVFDLVMVAHSSSGKERTEKEWKRILLEGEFIRYNIIKIPALQSVIEAFPR
eukprot:PITA_07497